MNKKLMFLSGAVSMFAPMLVFAQTKPECAIQGVGTIGGIICKIGELLNLVVPILMVIAVIYFVWGVITFVVAGDEEAKTAGRDKMIYGIIGLVVIVAMWGLVRIVVSTFGLNTPGNNTGFSAPCVPGAGISC